MKKLLTLIIVVLGLSSLSLTAANVYDLSLKTTTVKNSLASPSYSFSSNEDSFTASFKMNEVELVDDEIYSGRRFISIPSFGYTSKPSTPRLPVRTETIEVPKGKSAVVSITQSTYTEFSLTLPPSIPLLPEGVDLHDKSNVPDIASYSGFYNDQLVYISDYFIYRGNQLASIEISPVQYSVTQKKVRVYTSIKFTVTFVDTPDGDNYSDSALIPLNNYVVDPTWKNTHILGEYAVPGSGNFDIVQNDTRGFLIITVPEYESAAETFANWKRNEGYKCTIISEDNWNDTAVAAAIKDYAATDSSFYAFMIIGDVDRVPSNYVTVPAGVNTSQPGGYHKYYYTDVPYACLDGIYDEYPDVLYGRVPATDAENALAIINKIIAYESVSMKQFNYGFNPPVLKGVHASCFQPIKAYNNREGRAFITYSEKIRNYMQQNGYSVARVYNVSPVCTPKYFKDGTELPSDLQSPNFKWDGSFADISSQMNTGYIFYRGHGGRDLWGSPTVYTTDLKTLTNKRWFPIVYSIACSTGQMNTACLAKEFICLPNTGASGVLASSNLSSSVLNDCLSDGIFSSLVSSTINKGNWLTVGETLQQGLMNVTNSYGRDGYTILEYHTYNWFGDPTMRMYTESPVNISNVGISETSNSYIVNVGDQDVAITALYDSGDVVSYRKSNWTFKKAGCNTIAITGPNKLLKILDMGDPTDNQKTNVTQIKSTIFRNNTLTVNYYLNTHDLGLNMLITTPGDIVISSITGQTQYSYTCSPRETQINIDTSSWAAGTYTVTLTYAGQTRGHTTIIKR